MVNCILNTFEILLIEFIEINIFTVEIENLKMTTA